MGNDLQTVTVRAIRPDDYEQWLALWLAYQDFYEVTLQEAVSRCTFSRFFDPDEPVSGFVAVQGEDLVGLVNAVLHRSTWTVADYCYLEDLYVAPTVRGGGSGKMLIEQVRDFARQQGCSRLYWHTHQTNKRAQKLYNWVAEDSGFIEYRMTL
ncbi:GNAT family N-acetyltransferase [Pseudomonas sp. 15FMM2]|uniref:GNAT family N-acetyltransferase n=1 Tax=Pseudomonas imrae TaxID=2992837 RepID=A0ACC7PNK4_9PSED